MRFSYNKSPVYNSKTLTMQIKALPDIDNQKEKNTTATINTLSINTVKKSTSSHKEIIELIISAAIQKRFL